MTKNEATKELERHIQFLRENWKPYPDYDVIEALRMAISALEEIQQYRAIGTVEECRDAMEKQKPKKASVHDGLYRSYECPDCNYFLGYVYEYEDDYSMRHAYCPNCGQRLDWSKEEEE